MSRAYDLSNSECRKNFKFIGHLMQDTSNWNWNNYQVQVRKEPDATKQL